MLNSWAKAATFPCVTGMAYVLVEIGMMSFLNNTVISLAVSFVLCAFITAVLLLLERGYDGCGVLQQQFVRLHLLLYYLIF